LKELDATVLREFIDRINVSAVDKKSKTRAIEIVYNFIGAFDFTSANAHTQNPSRTHEKNGIAGMLYRFSCEIVLSHIMLQFAGVLLF